MKKINLSITRCINPKCDFRIVSTKTMHTCPICKSKTIKDKQHTAQGIMDSDNDCVILKRKKGKK